MVQGQPPSPASYHLCNLDTLYIIHYIINSAEIPIHLKCFEMFDFAIFQAIFTMWVYLGQFLKILMRTKILESKQVIFHCKTFELQILLCEIFDLISNLLTV